MPEQRERALCNVGEVMLAAVYLSVQLSSSQS